MLGGQLSPSPCEAVKSKSSESAFFFLLERLKGAVRNTTNNPSASSEILPSSAHTKEQKSVK